MAQLDARVRAADPPVYPATVFKALQLTPRASVRVLILGQDPYHGPGQAEGLAFSVPDGVRWPPSLRNIFKERQRDLGLPLPPAGRASLRLWADQGVLLLNTSLTVEAGAPGSHAKLGWRALTDEIIKDLCSGEQPMVFMLWGAQAQQCWLDAVQTLAGQGGQERHLVLRSNHPSPLSALRPPLPFIGCGHFGQAARWLQAQGWPCIDWRLGDEA
jgi:uracil-DNA glycosylase